MPDITVSLIKELRERTGVGIMECKKSLFKTQGNILLAIDDLRKSGQMTAIKKADIISKEGIIGINIAHDNKYAVILELNCETDFVAKNNNFRSFSNEILVTALHERITNIETLKNRFKKKQIELISIFNENINISRFNILQGNLLNYYLHGTRIGVIISASGKNITIKKELLKNIAMHIAASRPEYINKEDIPDNILAYERQIQLDIAMKSGKSNKIIATMVEGRMIKYMNEVSLMNQNFILDLNKTINQLVLEHNIKIDKFIRFEVGEKYK